jgi:hypothetical protein
MEAILDTLPGKKPLIKLSYRPPNCETPIEYLGTDITPNDAFFVRYHLSDIPQVDARTRKLAIGGDGANGEIQLGLDDLKRLTPVEVVAPLSVLWQPPRPDAAPRGRRGMGLWGKGPWAARAGRASGARTCSIGSV